MQNLSIKYFIIFIFITYFFNLVPIILYTPFLETIFQRSINISSFVIIKYIASVFLISSISILLADKLRFIFSIINKYIYYSFHWIITPKVVIFISIISIISFSILTSQYGLYSRYSAVFRISNTGYIGLMYKISVYYLYQYLIIDTFFFKLLNRPRIRNEKIAYTIAMIAFSPTIINATTNTLVFILILFKNNSFLNKINIISDVKYLITKSKLSIKLLMFSMISIVFSLVILISNLIKKSGGNSFDELTRAFLGTWGRFTTHSVSLLQIINGCGDQCSFYKPLNAIIWRVSYFFDKEFYLSQDLQNPNRINALNTYGKILTDRLAIAGSSSGPIASSFLADPLWFSLIFTLLIISIFLYNTKLIFNLNLQLNTSNIQGGIVFMLYYLLYHGYISDPLNYSIIVTPIYIPFTMLCIYARKSYRIRMNRLI